LAAKYSTKLMDSSNIAGHAEDAVRAALPEHGKWATNRDDACCSVVGRRAISGLKEKFIPTMKANYM
jgi:hypothetical protein